MNGTKKAAQQDAENSHFPFASLSAVGMCLKPMAFVTVEQGNVRVLPAAASCPTDRLTDLVPQVLKSLDRLLTAVIDNMAKKCENSRDESCGGSLSCSASDAVVRERRRCGACGEQDDCSDEQSAGTAGTAD